MLRKGIKQGAVENSTSGAFTLVMIILGFVIGYIMLIPEEARNELLDGTSSGTIGGDKNDQKTKIIGDDKEEALLYIKNLQLGPSMDDDDFEIDLESFQLYTEVQKSQYLQINPLHITRSIIYNNKKEVRFDVDNYDDLKHLQLHFKTEVAKGNLKVKINDVLISEINQKEFENSKDLSAPIMIAKNLLKKENNVLSFEITSPGIMFWRINKYDLDYVYLFESKEVSNRDAILTFDFSKEELSNMEDIKLQYGVVVTDPSNVEIYLNNRILFSGEPTYQGISEHKILKEDIKEHNTLTFSTKKGSYNFFDVSIIGDYKKSVDKRYYFTVEDKDGKYEIYFDFLNAVNEYFYIYLNGERYNIDTTISNQYVDVTSDIKEGRNELEFSPSSKIALNEVKVVNEE